MATKTYQIRIDSELKAQADAALAEMGLDTPSAVRVFLTKVVKTRSIPFTIGKSSDFEDEEVLDENDDSYYHYSREEEDEILATVEHLRQHPEDISEPFDNAEDLIASLKS